jgi:fibronectin-binding autotransporter adhesin
LSLLNASSGTVAVTVGGNGQSTTYSGALSGTGSSLTKTGAGTLTLSGANTFTSTTTVGAGTLLINGSTGNGAHIVANGGTLGGSGTISGAVTVQTGGTLKPGAGGLNDTLVISGNLVMNSNSTNTFNVDGGTLAHQTINLGGSVSYGGVLKIATSGIFTNNQSFALFTGAGAMNGSNFSSIQGSPGFGRKFAFTNGVLTVVPTVATNPTNITATVAGGGLTLSWPADHMGWRLEVQTNVLSAGLGTNWVTVEGSTTHEPSPVSHRSGRWLCLLPIGLPMSWVAGVVTSPDSGSTRGRITAAIWQNEILRLIPFRIVGAPVIGVVLFVMARHQS